MTGVVVAPVIPPKPRSSGLSGQAGYSADVVRMRRVPIPRLPEIWNRRSSTYGFAVLNDRGRIAAQSAIRSLGWLPGTRVTIHEQSRFVVVTAAHDGTSTVTPHGHLRVPAPLRRWCGMEAGDRVLVVADAAEQRLVIYPSAALDAMITRQYPDMFGGGCA